MTENGSEAARPLITTKDDSGGTEMTIILTRCMDSLDQNNSAVGPGINENFELATVIGCSILVLSIIGNIAVFLGMPFKINERDPLCTLHILLRKLVVADLLVTCFFLPKQVNWIKMDNFTSEWPSWIASDIACMAVAFFSSLGQYLSGFLIVAVTLDRCLAVRRRTIPSKAVRRAKIMSWAACGVSVIFSGIEAAVHHVEHHSLRRELKKCTFVGTFQSFEFELAYVTMERFFSFGFPFLMIIICYPCILWETCRSSSDSNDGTNGGRLAGTRTMKVSVAVVFLFFTCWAPYNIIYLWTFVDPSFYFKVPRTVQVMLRLLACANSCLNPFLYGYHYIFK